MRVWSTFNATAIVADDTAPDFDLGPDLGAGGSTGRSRVA
jgi:hypothetical protein